jgi:hypothetical protein
MTKKREALPRVFHRIIKPGEQIDWGDPSVQDLVDANDGLCAQLNVVRGRLAQRDREVLGLTEALGKVREEIGGCLERDAAAFMRMTLAESDAWGIARHNQSHGYVLDTIKAALASTAQAGAEAERKVLEAAWERLLAAFPPDGVDGEVVKAAKSAILGTKGMG